MSDHLKFALVLFTVAAFALFAAIWQNGKRFLASVLLLLAALIVVLFAMRAEAHDHSRPELNDWLAGLHSKSKVWCCRGDDTDAIDEWETKGDHYRVKFRGIWYDVPESAVVDGPNKQGDALLWMNKGYIGSSVRCFMPGSMT